MPATFTKSALVLSLLLGLSLLAGIARAESWPQPDWQTAPHSDSPALAVLRTVAMLANEAADALLQGVASAADIDLARRAGVNYPLGPLAWADAIGLAHVVKTLDNLQASYGEERSRPSLLLRRRLAEGSTLHA